MMKWGHKTCLAFEVDGLRLGERERKKKGEAETKAKKNV
jgi:hypothetical protein